MQKSRQKGSRIKGWRGLIKKDVLAISIHKEYDDGRMLYEGGIIYGNTDYDFEIDAQTGDILEWSEGKL